MLDRIGPYRIVRKLGEGGMGVVYAAHDERLDRAVAIKTIRETTSEIARERFMREGRAAAALSHPNVCQLYDIGEVGGEPYLVMELLDGEPLSSRLAQGPIPINESTQILLGVLTALDALHGRGLVHRDLKPSNVFLTPHGVKILDFGLARDTRRAMLPEDAPTEQFNVRNSITLPGMIVGSPRYMAPEQLLGTNVDHRADLFSTASVLYEMLSGKPVFGGESTLEIFHSVVYEQTPNLGGSALIAAINRVIQRAMAKRPDDRYQTATAMASDVREAMMVSDTRSAPVVRQMTRLIVLPLRVLRPDPETDFLAFAVPDAVTSSLAALESLVVRSPMAASKFTAEMDFTALAKTADVDAVLTGTMLRAGNQVRITAQLVETPAGTVLWSMTSQATVGDFFELQDHLTQRIVESLKIPLSDREQRLLHRDIPASPRAHELYLRATRQGESPADWAIALDLYEQAVAEDPLYAPAWARLARIHLLIAKYVEQDHSYAKAVSSIERALQLNPDLAIGHQIYALIEVNTGRANDAMLRLLGRLEHGSNDPNVFAGLVMATRFCGLLEASAAAHEQARLLDRGISTSAAHTYWMMGEYEKALAAIDMARDFTGDQAFIYESMGRLDEALAIVDARERELLARGLSPNFIAVGLMRTFRTLFREEAPDFSSLEGIESFPDPEGLYYAARCYARGGELERALSILDLMEQRGFACYPALVRDSWLDGLRGMSQFKEIMRRIETRHLQARLAFEQHPGSRLLALGARK